ncbi:unnamed protein product, partial [marine sediment metagenome]
MRYIFAWYHAKPIILFIIEQIDKHTYITSRTLRTLIVNHFKLQTIETPQAIANIIGKTTADLIALGVIEKYSRFT